MNSVRRFCSDMATFKRETTMSISKFSKKKQHSLQIPQFEMIITELLRDTIQGTSDITYHDY